VIESPLPLPLVPIASSAPSPAVEAPFVWGAAWRRLASLSDREGRFQGFRLRACGFYRRVSSGGFAYDGYRYDLDKR